MIAFLVASIINVSKKKLSEKDVTDIDKFDKIYSRYFPFAWRSLRGLGVPASMIDDAAQDVFIVVHKKLEKIDMDTNLNYWIFGIARKVASTYRRTIKRKGIKVELKAEHFTDTADSPYKKTFNNEILQHVEEYLATLDEKRRSIFVLAYLNQMHVTEISSILNININTIYSRLKVMQSQLETHMSKFIKNNTETFYG